MSIQRHFRIIASLINVYANGQKQKEFNKLEKQLGKTSEHMGTLRERGEFDLEVTYVKYIFGVVTVICVAKDLTIILLNVPKILNYK